MEDAHICQPGLYAEEKKAAGGGSNGKDDKGASASSPSSSSSGYRRIAVPRHSLFAVYDGHGGSFAAEYSGRNFCRVLSRQDKFVRYAKIAAREEEEGAGGVSGEEGGEGGGSGDAPSSPAAGDDVGSKTTDGGARDAAQRQREHLTLLEDALRDAFVELDREIMRAMKGLPNEGSDEPYGEIADGGEGGRGVDDESKDAPPGRAAPPDEDSGTTAVVVVLTPRWIVCANAGDSRAVYSKSTADVSSSAPSSPSVASDAAPGGGGGSYNNKVVPLSYDHKPDDEEEERRIRDAGGYVSGGRVEGDLAVSRGLGDFRFKDVDTVLAGAHSRPDPAKGGGGGDGGAASHSMMRPDDQMVSPVPDIIVQNRDPSKDEYIIVACDGIWDVQSNLESVRTVSEIFAEGESDLGVLCEEVLDVCLRRGSKDNMTSLVVRLEALRTGEGDGVSARRKLLETNKRQEGDGNGGQGEAVGGQTESEKRKREEQFSGSPGYS